MSESVLAFDIGGTWLKVAEVDRSGKIAWMDPVAPLAATTRKI